MSSLKKDPKTYWRSLAELADDPAVRERLAHEFPQSDLGADAGSVSRRRFMQLMGASLALSSGSACRWEKDYLLPFARRPVGHVPGVPQHYATAMELGGHAQPLQVTSMDGRPIKVDGAPDHPLTRGGSSALAQASVLEVYDPDRSQTLISRGAGGSAHSWGEFAAAIAPIMRGQAAGGAGLRVLSEATRSPSVARLRERLQAKYPQASWVEYEPLARDNERMGIAQALGGAFRAHYDFTRARTVLALDDNFLVEHPAATRYSRDFAQARRPGNEMVRLYAAESRFSHTGAMADHRLVVRSEQILPLLGGLAAALFDAGLPAPPDLAALRHVPNHSFLGEPRCAKFLRAVARDLLAQPGHGLVTVGPGQPAAAHALAHHLNHLLHNAGSTVAYSADPGPAPAPHTDGLRALVAQMARGEVSTLIILGGNPVYDAPPALQFASALAKVKHSLHLALFNDETSRACAWHLPRAHYLEAWGDARAYDGSYCLQQPLIKPLYNGRTPAELLALLLEETELHGQAIVKETFTSPHGLGAAGEARWHDAVRAGGVAGSAAPQVATQRQPLAVLPAIDARAHATEVDGQDLELTFWADSHTYDGRFANNGWLQELPDFLSKLTWDNVALIAPQTAAQLGIAHESLVTLKTAQGEMQLAAYVMPGQAPGSVAVSLGYGRREAGHVGGTESGGVDAVGFDTYAVWDGGSANLLHGASLRPTGKKYTLAITQDHHSMDTLAHQATERRVGEIVREGELAEYRHDPAFAQERSEHPPLKSLWQEFSYAEGHRWAMTIDLNACNGCNSCVVACQAENNIPIVGKEQVIRGREMHWIRIDRYFAGSPEAPSVASQPMLCQQCENAPCESVCPVAATVHSHEGLNDMVYNRCIGTRYCSNNCPYKVRRFNFFNYHKNLVDPRNQVAKMVYNPEVTVRARGVMEKCTYCIARIQNVKIVARNEKRAIADGEIVTACAQACPAGAIVFGDLNDPHSAVAESQKDSRAYAVLDHLNTKPRTEYKAMVRNPNPELS